MSHPLIGVAASADRLDALLEFLAALERSRLWSMVVTVHLADQLRFDLRDAMQCVCDVPVVDAIDGGYLQPGLIHLLPNDRKAGFQNSRVTLSPRVHSVESEAALVDDLLGSLARQPAPHGIGVILCATPTESIGLTKLRSSGGLAFVCDPAHRVREPDAAGLRNLYRTHSPSAIAIELGELFRLPYTHDVVRREGESPPRVRRSPAVLEQKRVLVVGRNAHPEGPMESLLESWGHQVVTASSTMDAVELAHAMDPDVSFIDVTVPEFPGHDICYRMRRLQADSDNLLVGVVSNEDSDEQLAALTAGFHALLSDLSDEAELRWLVASQPGSLTPGGWLFP